MKQNLVRNKPNIKKFLDDYCEILSEMHPIIKIKEYQNITYSLAYNDSSEDQIHY